MATKHEPSWPRTIAHADMDAFYAAVEQLDDPALRGKPVVCTENLNTNVVVMKSAKDRM